MPVLRPSRSDRSGQKVSAIDRLHYIEVAITSTQAQHPHLLFRDPQGRVTGFAHGRLINQIPGVAVVQNYSVQNWSAAPEPTYHLPLNHPDLTVTVDGGEMTSAVRTQLQVNGSGIVYYVQDIHIAPGQRDEMELPAKDLALSYATSSSFPASPVIGAQFPEIDLAATRPGRPRLRLITMATGSIGYAPRSAVSLIINPPTGQAVVGSAHARRLVAGARYVLSVDSSPLNGGLPERTYRSSGLPLPPNAFARFQYLRPRTATLRVDVFSSTGRPLGRLHAAAG